MSKDKTIFQRYVDLHVRLRVLLDAYDRADESRPPCLYSSPEASSIRANVAALLVEEIIALSNQCQMLAEDVTREVSHLLSVDAAGTESLVGHVATGIGILPRTSRLGELALLINLYEALLIASGAEYDVPATQPWRGGR